MHTEYNNRQRQTVDKLVKKAWMAFWTKNYFKKRAWAKASPLINPHLMEDREKKRVA
jgi:hypothetical protein